MGLAARLQGACWRKRGRLAALACAAAIVVLLVRQHRRTRTVVVDVNAETAKIARDARLVDGGRVFPTSGASSVHLHVMGHGQRSPLHVHPDQHEVAVVVAGAAEVALVSGPTAGKWRAGATKFGPGDLVHAPPWCGHEWANVSATGVLSTLVFSSPGWRGNLYVRPDDQRLERGRPGASFRLADAQVPPAAGAAVEEVPMTPGRLRLVVTTHEFAVGAPAPTAVFVRSGQGTLRRPFRLPVVLRPGTLAILPAGAGGSLTPDAGRPLTFIVFDVT